MYVPHTHVCECVSVCACGWMAKGQPKQGTGTVGGGLARQASGRRRTYVGLLNVHVDILQF